MIEEEVSATSGPDAPRDLAPEDLARIAANAGMPKGRRAPQECGHFDIHIGYDGSWFYRGSPIKRMSLVRLFATVLSRDDSGTFWLTTPAERGRVTVADAPILAVELQASGSGRQQEIILNLNIDQTVALGRDHPLRLAVAPSSGEPRPYALWRNGLEARLLRPVFYDLVELGTEERVGDATLFGVWSMGTFFPLGDPVQWA